MPIPISHATIYNYDRRSWLFQGLVLTISTRQQADYDTEHALERNVSEKTRIHTHVPVIAEHDETTFWHNPGIGERCRHFVWERLARNRRDPLDEPGSANIIPGRFPGPATARAGAFDDDDLTGPHRPQPGPADEHPVPRGQRGLHALADDRDDRDLAAHDHDGSRQCGQRRDRAQASPPHQRAAGRWTGANRATRSSSMMASSATTTPARTAIRAAATDGWPWLDRLPASVSPAAVTSSAVTSSASSVRLRARCGPPSAGPVRPGRTPKQAQA